MKSMHLFHQCRKRRKESVDNTNIVDTVTLFGYIVYIPTVKRWCRESRLHNIRYKTLSSGKIKLQDKYSTKLLILRIWNGIVKFQGQENTKKTETVKGKIAGLRIPISGVTGYGTVTRPHISTGYKNDSHKWDS